MPKPSIADMVYTGTLNARTVWKQANSTERSKECDHDWFRMHHTGADGKHYCPTGFDWCYLCGTSRESPDDVDWCLYWDELVPDLVAILRGTWKIQTTENFAFALVTKL